MERHRLSLVATVLAGLILVAAAPLPQPAAGTATSRLSRVVTVTPEPPDAPPLWGASAIRLRGAEPAALIADSARILAPRLTAALAPGARMNRPLPATFIPAAASSDPAVRGSGAIGTATDDAVR